MALLKLNSFTNENYSSLTILKAVKTSVRDM